MVENRKDDCNYPKGLCVDRHSEILSLGSREGQEGTRKASRCDVYRKRQNKVFQENSLCGLCPQLFYLHREKQHSACLNIFFTIEKCIFLTWIKVG